MNKHKDSRRQDGAQNKRKPRFIDFHGFDNETREEECDGTISRAVAAQPAVLILSTLAGGGAGSPSDPLCLTYAS